MFKPFLQQLPITMQKTNSLIEPGWVGREGMPENLGRGWCEVKELRVVMSLLADLLNRRYPI